MLLLRKFPLQWIRHLCSFDHGNTGCVMSPPAFVATFFLSKDFSDLRRARKMNRPPLRSSVARPTLGYWIGSAINFEYFGLCLALWWYYYKNFGPLQPCSFDFYLYIYSRNQLSWPGGEACASWSICCAASSEQGCFFLGRSAKYETRKIRAFKIEKPKTKSIQRSRRSDSHWFQWMSNWMLGWHSKWKLWWRAELKLKSILMWSQLRTRSGLDASVENGIITQCSSAFAPAS